MASQQCGYLSRCRLASVAHKVRVVDRITTNYTQNRSQMKRKEFPHRKERSRVKGRSLDRIVHCQASEYERMKLPVCVRVVIGAIVAGSVTVASSVTVAAGVDVPLDIGSGFAFNSHWAGRP